MKVVKTTAIDVDDFASGLTNGALHCRELGHVWRPLTVSFDRSAGAYDRRLRCSSCRTVRVQVLNSHGHTVSNRYVYPDGYLAKGVETGMTNRDVFRLEAITRFLSASKEGGA